MTADNAIQTTFNSPQRTESLIIQKKKKKLFIGFSLKKKKLNICQITIEI